MMPVTNSTANINTHPSSILHGNVHRCENNYRYDFEDKIDGLGEAASLVMIRQLRDPPMTGSNLPRFGIHNHRSLYAELRSLRITAWTHWRRPVKTFSLRGRRSTAHFLGSQSLVSR